MRKGRAQLGAARGGVPILPQLRLVSRTKKNLRHNVTSTSPRMHSLNMPVNINQNIIKIIKNEMH